MKRNLNYTVPDDGVLFKATINPKVNLHDGITFKYRPTDPVERKTFGFKISRLQEAEKDDQAAYEEFKGTLDRVESWTIDLPVQQFVDRKAKINPELYQEMYRVIWGFMGADELEVVTKNS